MSNSVHSNPFQEFYSSFSILQFYNFEFTSNLHRDKTVACNKSIRMRPITPEN